MPCFSLFFGGLMIGLGLTGYLAPGTFGSYNEVSPTALIPAFIGGVLVLCGLVTLAKPSLRKHAMHFAALAGVIGFAGGFMPMRSKKFDFTQASAVSGALLSGLSLLFVILCVQSFIAARKARKANQS